MIFIELNYKNNREWPGKY